MFIILVLNNYINIRFLILFSFQVLFCSLTDEQRKLYKKYLLSEDVSFVLHEKSSFQETGRYRARLLIALSALRKICNHPDLYLYTNQMVGL